MSAGPKNPKDHYAVLGVPRDADAETIKKAYRKLAKECHPDVAGEDPETATRFRRVQEAWKVLKDPKARRSYDRRFQPRRPRMGPKGYRMPGGFHFQTAGGTGGSPSGPRVHARSARMDMEDLVSDFGFGDSDVTPGPGTRRPPRPSKDSGDPEEFWRPSNGRGRTPRPSDPESARTAGGDIRFRVEVEAPIAHKGGSVELRYPRLRVSDDGGSLHRYHEITHLRVPPNTATGAVLRCARMGNASLDGGCGELVCDIVVIPAKSGRGASRDRKGARRSDSTGDVRVLEISLTEAVLGGRAEVTVGGKALAVTIPPLSSSGRRLRLKGKGSGGGDLFFELRIVLPKEIDEESRELIERFAELNPNDPRKG